jgi:hypothetical protein
VRDDTSNDVTLSIDYSTALRAARGIVQCVADTAKYGNYLQLPDINAAANMAATLIGHAMQMDRPVQPTKDELIAAFVERARKLGKPIRKRRRPSKKKAAKRGNAAAA